MAKRKLPMRLAGQAGDLVFADIPAARAHSHGHHVPGTPYKYKHGWIPIVPDVGKPEVTTPGSPPSRQEIEKAGERILKFAPGGHVIFGGDDKAYPSIADALEKIPPSIRPQVTARISQIVIEHDSVIPGYNPSPGSKILGYYNPENQELHISTYRSPRHGDIAAHTALHETMHAYDNDPASEYGHRFSSSYEWRDLCATVRQTGPTSSYFRLGLSLGEPGRANRETFAELAADYVEGRPLSVDNDMDRPLEDPAATMVRKYFDDLIGEERAITRPVRSQPQTCIAMVDKDGKLRYATVPATRASVKGHHVPGTPYKFYHGWIPRSPSAPQRLELTGKNRQTMKGADVQKLDKLLQTPKYRRGSKKHAAGELARPALPPYRESTKRVRDSILADIEKYGTLEMGKQWYPDELKQAKRRAQVYHVSLEQAVGVEAATSPRAQYSVNQHVTNQILDAAPVFLKHRDVLVAARDREKKIRGGVMPKFRSDAVNIVMGGDIDANLGGPKERAFYNNILHPGETDDVTVDTWMLLTTQDGLGLSRDQALEMNTEKFQNGHIGTMLVADAVRDASAELKARGTDVSPDAVQAAAWIAMQMKRGIWNPASKSATRSADPDLDLLNDDQWDAELLIDYLTSLVSSEDVLLDLGSPTSAREDGSLAAENYAAWGLVAVDPRFRKLGIGLARARQLALANRKLATRASSHEFAQQMGIAGRAVRSTTMLRTQRHLIDSPLSAEPAPLDDEDRLVIIWLEQQRAATLAHEPVHGGKGKGLWGHKGWQLPAYIQHVANDLIEAGHMKTRAIQMAIGIIKNWAHGHDGKGHRVSATTQTKAIAALAEWTRLKLQAKLHKGR